MSPQHQISNSRSRWDFWWKQTLLVLSFLAGMWVTNSFAEEAEWIWSPQHDTNSVPHTACHFRKTIVVDAPQRGTVSVVADDAYELFLNGRKVGSGESSERMKEHDVTRHLSRGRNLIALKVVNRRGATAGVAARVMVQNKEGDWQSFSTDASWKTNLRPLPFWNTTLYNDSRWVTAKELGPLGETAPWDVRENVAATETAPTEQVLADTATGRQEEPVESTFPQPSTERFRISDEFQVEQLLDNEKVGSLIAAAFNEFGHLLASREGGPLLLIYDEDEDGRLDTVREYCRLVKNCQGILALNGNVYVTADGPEGAALYRLRDENRDGILERVEAIIRFGETMGEHGPHGLTLGPDGLIYLIVGNYTDLEIDFADSSPHQNYYEGDLNGPRYEDPSGHATGRPAFGGGVIRTDVDGKTIELVAGGFRNAYDLAFDRMGNLFVHDSDMESDMGMTWYRPTRLYHVIAGAEFGWRSGWAKWPDYYLDALPGLLDTGRGSPTGAVFYNHFAFPVRYQHRLFLADWSEGRILSVKLKQDGATLSSSSEVFLEGHPLNVTDLDVDPNGDLVFVTGGRGTAGGVYRVHWTGRIPEAVSNLGSGMSAAIRQPQMHSAWGRQAIAEVRQSLGDAWGKQLRGVARSSANPWYYRTQALDLMQLFGPRPTAELLIRLSRDGNEIVRCKAVELMGIHSSVETRERLIDMLKDPDRAVRRQVCEALVRAEGQVDIDELIPLLTSDDRFEAWAARRLLERLPVTRWRDKLIENPNHRLVIQGGLALMIVQPTKENALLISHRFEELLDEFVTDRDFIDLLRVTQVALHRGGVAADVLPSLASKLGDEFPSSDDIMNRELVRLLAYLQVTGPMKRYLAYLRSDAANLEKLHVALHLRFLQDGWTTEQKLQLIRFYETAKTWDGGSSYARYLANFERDFGKTFSAAESKAVLAGGKAWPEAAVGALYSLPAELDSETMTTLIDLDQDLMTADSEEVETLRIGLLAVLARDGDPLAFQYLRFSWDNEPERRESVALGLAQQPDGDNWEYLTKSLGIVEGGAAQEVLRQLATVDRSPEHPEPVRQVILRGLELNDEAAVDAIKLLEHWTGQTARDAGEKTSAQLEAWQVWFNDSYPEQPRAELPVASEGSPWKFDELLHHLESEAGGSGSPIRGAAVFEKAECIKCHRFGNRGESIGPDLTSLRKRFMKKEVLESTLFPSHVISDQYASKAVALSSGRVLNGLVTKTADGNWTILLPTGEKKKILDDDVEEMAASRVSVMPANLLDKLSLQEISDLFAYLGMAEHDNVARQPTSDRARR